jgi:hypothetical protein
METYTNVMKIKRNITKERRRKSKIKISVGSIRRFGCGEF